MTNTSDAYTGAIDCETTVIGSGGALDCIKKDDFVMLLNTQNDVQAAASNPVYPNLYQVKKISREAKTHDFIPNLPDSEAVRRRLVLDYSLNFNHQWAGGNANPLDTAAQVYKFYPPPLANQYHYAGECSHRGICNTKSGLCQCFPGYSEDNCGVVNAISN
jgi:hypothetical protein